MNDDHPWDSINNGWWDGNRQLPSVMDTHSKRRAHHWPLPIGIRYFCHAHLKEIGRSLQPEQAEQVEDLLQSAEPDHINMTWHPRGHTVTLSQISERPLRVSKRPQSLLVS
jgi:hypothetical protein